MLAKRAPLCRVVAGDVGDEVGGGEGEDADAAVGADLGDDVVGDGGAGGVVDVAGGGWGGAAGEGGGVSGAEGSGDGEVEDGGGGVAGDVVASGDLDLGDGSGGSESGAFALAVDGGDAGVGAGVEEPAGDEWGVGGAGGVVAGDVGDEVGGGEGEDADAAVGADLGDDVVGDGGAGGVVDVAGGGWGGAAGEGGGVSGAEGSGDGEVEDGGGGVAGDVVASGDLDLGDGSGGSESGAFALAVDGGDAGVGAGVEEPAGDEWGVGGAGWVVAGDVGDEVGGGEGEDADAAVGADLGDDVVGDGGAGGVVDVAGGGWGGAAGEGGGVSGAEGSGDGEVEDGGGGVAGDVVASGDLDLGDGSGGSESGAFALAVDGGDAGVGAGVEEPAGHERDVLGAATPTAATEHRRHRIGGRSGLDVGRLRRTEVDDRRTARVRLRERADDQRGVAGDQPTLRAGAAADQHHVADRHRGGWHLHLGRPDGQVGGGLGCAPDHGEAIADAADLHVVAVDSDVPLDEERSRVGVGVERREGDVDRAVDAHRDEARRDTGAERGVRRRIDRATVGPRDDPRAGAVRPALHQSTAHGGDAVVRCRHAIDGQQERLGWGDAGIDARRRVATVGGLHPGHDREVADERVGVRHDLAEVAGDRGGAVTEVPEQAHRLPVGILGNRDRLRRAPGAEGVGGDLRRFLVGDVGDVDRRLAVGRGAAEPAGRAHVLARQDDWGTGVVGRVPTALEVGRRGRVRARLAAFAVALRRHEDQGRGRLGIDRGEHDGVGPVDVAERRARGGDAEAGDHERDLAAVRRVGVERVDAHRRHVDAQRARGEADVGRSRLGDARWPGCDGAQGRGVERAVRGSDRRGEHAWHETDDSAGQRRTRRCRQRGQPMKQRPTSTVARHRSPSICRAREASSAVQRAP